MRPSPTQKLDPRIKNVWRISAIITTLVCDLCIAIPLLAIGAADDSARWATVAFGIETALFALAVIFFVFVLPPIRYKRWSYQLDPEFLEIERGIFWRKRFVIPFIRVQNTDTQQGPLMRAFGMSSVTISTAAGSHEIPGIDNEQAAELRDKAAEFARIAREDV